MLGKWFLQFHFFQHNDEALQRPSDRANISRKIHPLEGHLYLIVVLLVMVKTETFVYYHISKLTTRRLIGPLHERFSDSLMMHV